MNGPSYDIIDVIFARLNIHRKFFLLENRQTNALIDLIKKENTICIWTRVLQVKSIRLFEHEGSDFAYSTV